MNSIAGNEPASHGSSGHISTVTREEILAHLRDPSLGLVNVMPREVFEAGHIPRSINLPVVQINDKARQVFPDSARELIIYCAGPT